MISHMLLESFVKEAATTFPQRLLTHMEHQRIQAARLRRGMDFTHPMSRLVEKPLPRRAVVGTPYAQELGKLMVASAPDEKLADDPKMALTKRIPGMVQPRLATPRITKGTKGQVPTNPFSGNLVNPQKPQKIAAKPRRDEPGAKERRVMGTGAAAFGGSMLGTAAAGIGSTALLSSSVAPHIVGHPDAYGAPEVQDLLAKARAQGVTLDKGMDLESLKKSPMLSDLPEFVSNTVLMGIGNPRYMPGSHTVISPETAHPAFLAHELGHSIGRTRESAKLRHAAGMPLRAFSQMSPLVGVVGGGVAARHDDPERRAAGLRRAQIATGIAGGVSHGATLAEEGLASFRALRAAHKFGKTKEYAKILGPAFGTYALNTLPVLGTMGALEIARRRALAQHHQATGSTPLATQKIGAAPKKENSGSRSARIVGTGVGVGLGGAAVGALTAPAQERLSSRVLPHIYGSSGYHSAFEAPENQELLNRARTQGVRFAHEFADEDLPSFMRGMGLNQQFTQAVPAAYVAQSNRVITPRGAHPAILAHELGHSVGNTKLRFGAAMPLRLLSGTSGAIGVVGGAAAARHEDPERRATGLRRAQIAAGTAGVLGHGAILGEEGLASFRAMRAAHKFGKTKEYAKILGPAFGTYALNALPVLGTMGALEIARRRALTQHHQATGSTPLATPKIAGISGADVRNAAKATLGVSALLGGAHLAKQTVNAVRDPWSEPVPKTRGQSAAIHAARGTWSLGHEPAARWLAAQP